MKGWQLKQALRAVRGGDMALTGRVLNEDIAMRTINTPLKIRRESQYMRALERLRGESEGIRGWRIKQ